jgi:hypothetical protein
MEVKQVKKSTEWMRTSKKKCQKIPKSTRKYTDLVFYRLYKRIPFVQKPTSAAKRLLAPFAYLLFTIYFCLETDQMRSNAAKCGQAQSTFADVVAWAC